MKKEYSQKLTADEIYVLAGAFGYSALTGVDGNVLRSWSGDMKRHVRETTGALEEKGLVFFGINGKLDAPKELKRSFACLADADRIVTVKKSSPKGRRYEVLFFEKGEDTLILGRDRFLYRMDLYTGYDTVKGVLKLAGPVKGRGNMSEIMLFEEAEEVRRNMSSFMEDDAENIVRNIVRDPSDAKPILDAFSGERGYLSVSVSEKTAAMYKRLNGMFLSLGETDAFSVIMDENGVMRFKDADTEDLRKLIRGEL